MSKSINLLVATLFFLVMMTGVSGNVFAADKYKFDPSHSVIMFKVSHLGYSWIYGRFNKFDGSFQLDEENLANSSVSLTIDTASVDTNWPKRDKHIRDQDFLSVEDFPKASFASTMVKPGKEGFEIEGDFLFMGKTIPLTLKMNHVGGGKDPWGGYRNGYEGTARFNTRHFKMKYPKAADMDVELIFVVEGIRQ